MMAFERKPVFDVVRNMLGGLTQPQVDRIDAAID